MLPFSLQRRCARCCAALDRSDAACPVCGCRQQLSNDRLAGRYRIGEPCIGLPAGLFHGFDEAGGRRILLEIDPGAHRERFFRRAEMLMRLTGSPLLVPVLDAFDTAEGAVCVHAEPEGIPMPLRAFLPEQEEVTQLLSAAADALLVLHSLCIGHGALTAEQFYAGENGSLCLFVPAAASDAATPYEDLMRLGQIASLLHGRISKRQDTILAALAAGRYGTALELRHALGALTAPV